MAAAEADQALLRPRPWHLVKAWTLVCCVSPGPLLLSRRRILLVPGWACRPPCSMAAAPPDLVCPLLERRMGAHDGERCVGSRRLRPLAFRLKPLPWEEALGRCGSVDGGVRWRGTMATKSGKPPMCGKPSRRPLLWPAVCVQGHGWWRKVDLSDAFGSIQSGRLWQALGIRLGAEAAIDILNVTPGRDIYPEWLSMRGKKSPSTRGADVGGGEIGGTLELGSGRGDGGDIALIANQEEKMRVTLPNLAGSEDGRPHSKATSEEWPNHLAFEDGLLLVGRHAADVEIMFEDMVEALRKWGMTIRDDELRLWCSHKREEGFNGIPGRHFVRRRGYCHHTPSEEWAKSWYLKIVLCSRALRKKTRLQRLRTEVVPVLLWG